MPYQWLGEHLPPKPAGGWGHGAAAVWKLFLPEQVDLLWLPLHPGPPVRVCCVPLTRQLDGLISWWARACEWSQTELCVSLQCKHTHCPSPLSLMELWCARRTCRITWDLTSCVTSVLGLHPDTLISTAEVKGVLFFYFKAKTLTTENCLVMSKPECGLLSFYKRSRHPLGWWPWCQLVKRAVARRYKPH